MKKLLLASAVAALSVSAAQAAPTIYGKAFVTTDYVNAELDYNDKNTVKDTDLDVNSLQINSNGSKIGFRGSEAMTANTDLVYQLEYGISVDGDDDGVAFKSRDTYLGAKNNNFGEVRFGKNSSVLGYVNNVTVNQGYWDNLGNTKIGDEKKLKALNMADEDRKTSSIVWMEPKFNGMPLELALMYSADENFVADNDDRHSGYGASLMADPGYGLTAGVAYTKDMDIVGDVLRGTVTYDLTGMTAAPVKLGALYQVADYDYKGSEKEKGLVVSAEMGLNNFARPASVYAQYNNTTDLNGVKDSDSNQLVVGGKYMYKDNMIAHAYVGANSADDAIVKNGLADANVFAIGGGLEYKF